MMATSLIAKWRFTSLDVGLIQTTVLRDDAPGAGPAWDVYSGLV